MTNMMLDNQENAFNTIDWLVVATVIVLLFLQITRASVKSWIKIIRLNELENEI